MTEAAKAARTGEFVVASGKDIVLKNATYVAKFDRYAWSSASLELVSENHEIGRDR